MTAILTAGAREPPIFLDAKIASAGRATLQGRARARLTLESLVK